MWLTCQTHSHPQTPLCWGPGHPASALLLASCASAPLCVMGIPTGAVTGDAPSQGARRIQSPLPHVSPLTRQMPSPQTSVQTQFTEHAAFKTSEPVGLNCFWRLLPVEMRNTGAGSVSITEVGKGCHSQCPWEEGAS